MSWADALQKAAQEFDAAVKDLEEIKAQAEKQGLTQLAKRLERNLVLLRGVKEK